MRKEGAGSWLGLNPAPPDSTLKCVQRGRVRVWTSQVVAPGASVPKAVAYMTQLHPVMVFLPVASLRHHRGVERKPRSSLVFPLPSLEA